MVVFCRTYILSIYYNRVKDTKITEPYIKNSSDDEATMVDENILRHSTMFLLFMSIFKFNQPINYKQTIVYYL